MRVREATSPDREPGRTCPAGLTSPRRVICRRRGHLGQGLGKRTALSSCMPSTGNQPSAHLRAFGSTPPFPGPEPQAQPQTRSPTL